MAEKNVFTARHQEITDTLRQQIRTRQWKYGEKLPTQQELCQQFSVSPITIKRVIKTLCQEGLLRTVRGTGCFVSWKKEQEYYSDFSINSRRVTKITHSLLNPTPTYSYIMHSLADAFMAQNKHVDIVLHEIRQKNSEDPYLQMLTNGQLPVCGEFFWHALYARLNMLYPLERFSELAELQEDLLPGSCLPTQDGGNDEHIHALRLYTGIPIFTLINQERMEKVGLPSNTSAMTWPKLLKLAQKFSAESKDPTVYTTTLALPESYHGVKPFIELMGQDLFNRTKSPVTPQDLCSIFSSESAFEALENLRTLLDCGKVLYNMGHPRFTLGDVGILPFSTSWDMSLIQMLNPSLKYFASPMPTGKHHRKYCSFSSGFYVGIFRNSISSDLQLHAAWEWLQFLFHKRSQYLLSQEFKFPSRRGADSYLQQQTPMLNSMANNMLKNSIPQPDFPGIRQAYSTIGRELTAFILEKNPPDICLRNIREKLLIQFN